MRAHTLLSLLYAGVGAILVTLAIFIGYALGGDGADEAPPSFRGAVSAGSDAYRAGKAVWDANGCGSCHNKNVKDDATGPALLGVTDRWAAYPREDLRAWIRNSQGLLASGHPQAVKLWDAWRPTVMSGYPNLSDEEIDHLLAYIEENPNP